MRVLVITAAAPVVDLATAKAHLRLYGDTSDEDAYIEGLVAAATAWLDGPAGWLGRCIGQQTLQLAMDDFEEHWRDREEIRRRARVPFDQIPLPYPPLVQVDSVKYLDAQGADQTLDPALYTVASASIRPAYQTSWPIVRSEPESVRIQYKAGYEAPPAAILHAILLLTGHFYMNREAVVGVDNRDSSTPLPIGVDSLLSPYRVWN